MRKSAYRKLKSSIYLFKWSNFVNKNPLLKKANDSHEWKVTSAVAVIVMHFGAIFSGYKTAQYPLKNIVSDAQG